MRHAKQYKRGSRGKAAVFFVVLFGFAIFSMLLPLRPTRGDYTQGIDTWFADTFPLRDVFRQLNNWVESLYGIKTVEIVGNVEQGDEIPDAPFTGE